jgi:hypothetical protein
MAQDKSIVTIYDLKNGGTPLITHAIDAKEFLSHPSGRWSTSPDILNTENSAPLETKEDSGETTQLKLMSLRVLQAMADKAGIPDYKKLNKADLVAALEAK